MRRGRSLIVAGRDKELEPRIEVYSDLSFGERIKAAFALVRWPSGNRGATTNAPGWPEQWVNHIYQLQQGDLGPLDAFLQTPTVAAGVDKLQRDVAQGRWQVWKGHGKARTKLERTGRLVDEGGNLLDLLHYGNKNRTGRQNLVDLVGSRLLNGNGYWFLQRYGSRKEPVEIVNYPGQNVRPVPGLKRSNAGFELKRGLVNAWEAVDADAMIHFPRFNPNDEPVGLSPLKQVANSYLAEFYALGWIRDFFKNGAIMPGVWTTTMGRDGMPVGKPLTEAGIRAIQDQIARLHTSVDRRWLPIIVQGLEFLAAGMTLDQMKLQDQIAIVEQKVARALGIPPTVLGIKEGAGMLSTASATEDPAYWIGTVQSMGEDIDDILTARLAPSFGDDYEIELSFDHVLAIANARLMQAETLSKLAGNRSIISVDEARDNIGYPSTGNPDDAELYVPPTPAIGGFGADGEPKPAAKGEDKPEPKKPARQSLLRASDTKAGRRKKNAQQLAAFERQIQAFVVERLAEQRAECVAAAKAMAKEGRLALQRNGHKVELDALDISFSSPEDEEAERLARALRRMLVERGDAAIKDLEALAGVSLEVDVEMTNSRAAAYVAQLVDRSINLPDQTTRRMLAENLAKAAEDGGGLTEMLAAIHDTFDARRSQALTIARTESLAAYNYASMEAWRQSEVVERVEWLTSRSGLGGRHSEDPDQRYTDLDGQVRHIGEDFNVGGHAMAFPGDPRGGANEVCNCVCALNPIIEESRLSARCEAIRLQHALSRRNEPAGNGAPPAGGRIARFLIGARGK